MLSLIIYLFLQRKQICNYYNFTMNTQQIIRDRLLEYGIKPSLHRIAIMEYLMTHATHPTADIIFNDLYPSIPTLSKTTVYNTLKLFTEQGAILCINIDEKNARYDGDTSQHAHFKCKICGCVYDLSIEGLDSILVEGVGKLSITESQLYYKGYCEKCTQELNSKTN